MAFVYKTVGYLLLLTILGLYHEAQAGAAATWFVQGKALTSNTTFTVNSGEAFGFLCKATGSANVAANAAGAQTGRAKLIVTKNNPVSALTQLTRTVSTAGVLSKMTTTSGTFVYNSYEGIFSGFDHWEVSVRIDDTRVTNFFPSAVAQIVIPSASAVDAGTYFCTFLDGSTATAAAATTFSGAIAFSNGLTLTVNTIKAPSHARNLATNKMMDYSFALLAAYKVMF